MLARFEFKEDDGTSRRDPGQEGGFPANSSSTAPTLRVKYGNQTPAGIDGLWLNDPAGSEAGGISSEASEFPFGVRLGCRFWSH
jgi:hypothetical protein